MALQIGTIFLSMSKGRPDPETGRIGHWKLDELAEELRQWVLLGTDWLERHGHPITPSPLTSLLTALAIRGPAQDGTTTTAAVVAPASSREEPREPPPEAMIGGNVLLSLNLEQSPLL